MSVQTAVEGSSKLYLTLNGMNVLNFSKLRRHQWFRLLGIIRPYFTVSKEFQNGLTLRLDYAMNLTPAATRIIPDGTVKDFLSMAKVSLAVLY